MRLHRILRGALLGRFVVVVALVAPRAAASEVPPGTLVVAAVDATGCALAGRCFVLYGQAGGAHWLEDAAFDGDDGAAEGRTRFAPPAGAYSLCESRVPLRAEAPAWAVAVAGHAETTLAVRLAARADSDFPVG